MIFDNSVLFGPTLASKQKEVEIQFYKPFKRVQYMHETHLWIRLAVARRCFRC